VSLINPRTNIVVETMLQDEYRHPVSGMREQALLNSNRLPTCEVSQVFAKLTKKIVQLNV
jgi:hypothetical protein